MDVPTLTMPADLAQEKYEQYKAALEEGRSNAAHSVEDAEIMLGYKALAAGKQLLDLRQVFRTCPLTEAGLPKLAIARASWRWCHFDISSGFAVFASAPRFTYVWSTGKKPFGHVRIRLEDMPAQTPRSLRSRHRALVPIIPVTIRPNAADLGRYHILFEAEWQPIAPKDPLLLKRLSGSLYVILAAWDLTDLERAVLAGRLLENQP